MFRRKPASKKELLIAIASPKLYHFGPFAWYWKWKLDRAVADRFKLISNRRERLFYRVFLGLYVKVKEIPLNKGKK